MRKADINLIWERATKLLLAADAKFIPARYQELGKRLSMTLRLYKPRPTGS
jgi:hypothetical protein